MEDTHKQAIGHARSVLRDPSARKQEIYDALSGLVRAAEYFEFKASEAAPIMNTVRSLIREMIDEHEDFRHTSI